MVRARVRATIRARLLCLFQPSSVRPICSFPEYLLAELTCVLGTRKIPNRGIRLLIAPAFVSLVAGWYILSANEICATLAIARFYSNMTAMPATKAANTLTNFGGTARHPQSLSRLFVCRTLLDYWFHYFSTGNGCFNTVSNTSTTTASPCKPHHVCQQADSGQLAMLYVTLVLTALGSSGIRPFPM